MASVPDFDPNNPFNAQDKDRLNRMSAGLYEMGSTFKSFTTAMALDSGKVTLESRFDASRPITIGHQTIHDFHGKGRVLTRAGSVHLLLQHRLGARGRRGRHRRPPRVPAPAGPARPHADRTAGGRATDRAEGLEEGQFDHHRLRPRRLDDAAADGGRLRRADERRLPDRADLPAAQPGRGDGGRQAGGQRKDRRGACAISTG